MCDVDTEYKSDLLSICCCCCCNCNMQTNA